jgi:hypothetical protein
VTTSAGNSDPKMVVWILLLCCRRGRGWIRDLSKTPTTSRPACGLSTAERTGSPVFHTLWSYVLDLCSTSLYLGHAALLLPTNSCYVNPEEATADGTLHWSDISAKRKRHNFKKVMQHTSAARGEISIINVFPSSSTLGFCATFTPGRAVDAEKAQRWR